MTITSPSPACHPYEAPVDPAVLQVPTELLCQIFQESVTLENPPLKSWEHEPDEHRSRKNLLRSRIRLTHVCCQWREVAHGFPRLWADLQVYTWSEQKQSGHSRFIKEWFQRSGSLMLDLRLLYYAEGARTTLLTGLPPSLHPFVPFASRMRSLTFRFRCSDTVYSFLHHISPHLPALESLELDLKIISEEHCHYPDSVFAFSTSTKLQSLKVNVDRGELLNFISFPSDQLTSFELVYEAIGRNWYFDMKADALLNMLSGFDNLIDCKINCPDRIVESSSSNSTVVILQHLRSLELHVEDQSWINPTGNYWHILSALKTPSLESLHLHHQDHEDSPAYSYFGIFLLSDFQKRSQAPISELTLSGVPFCSRDELMTVLGNFSSVTRLSYLCGDFDIGILMDVLRCREGHEPLLPGLNYLAFDLLGESIHRINCIGDLLDSRWWPREEAESETPPSCTQRSVSRLEHIHIGKIDSYCFTSLYGFSPEVQRRIDACRKQGLRLDNYPYSLEVAKGMDCTIS